MKITIGLVVLTEVSGEAQCGGVVENQSRLVLDVSFRSI